MPIYIILMKFTDQGIKEIKNEPQRIGQGTKILEGEGGKVIGSYFVMGEYDRVVIMEAPSDEVAMTLMLRVGSRGYVRTTTLKAFTPEEFVQMIKKLP